MSRTAMLMIALTTACGRTGLQHEDDRSADDDNPGVQTCRDVDFLFVIDNSSSMADNQNKLVAQYDTFIDGFIETVERVESVHVGVVTTDAYQPNNIQCRELGGLVVATGGTGSSSSACGPYSSGKNYMSDKGELDDAFRCAAQVGTDGSASEASLSASIAAISSPMTDAGACNEGFIRDGALLVIVIVTDEDADVDPLFAISALADAKGGNEQDIVLVALANGPDSGCPLEQHARTAYGLADLTNLFSYGFLGPICAPDYAQVFTDALAVVEAACTVD